MLKTLQVKIVHPKAKRIRKGLLLSEKIVFLFLTALFGDLETLAKKRKFHWYFDASHVDNFLQVLVEIADVVAIRSLVKICRGPKNNFLLALAKDGEADCLITGDHDLLTLKKLGKTKIVTLNEFEKILSEREPGLVVPEKKFTSKGKPHASNAGKWERRLTWWFGHCS